MATQTSNIDLTLPARGEYVDTWDIPMNGNFQKIDNKLGSFASFTSTGGTITPSVDDVAYAVLAFYGTLTSDFNVVLPGINGVWLVQNNTTGAHNLTIKGTPANPGYSVPQATMAWVYSNSVICNPVLGIGAVVQALGYVPANKAGDTFSGGVTIASGGLSVTGGTAFNNAVTINSGNLTIGTGQIVAGAAGIVVNSSGALTLNGGALTLSTGYATLNGGVAIGTSATAPTSTLGDSSTNIATTAFVYANSGLATASVTFMAVGDFAICQITGSVSVLNAGATTAGSNLTIPGYGTGNSPASPTGTWKMQGAFQATNNYCLFKRIA